MRTTALVCWSHCSVVWCYLQLKAHPMNTQPLPLVAPWSTSSQTTEASEKITECSLAHSLMYCQVWKEEGDREREWEGGRREERVRENRRKGARRKTEEGRREGNNSKPDFSHCCTTAHWERNAGEKNHPPSSPGSHRISCYLIHIEELAVIIKLSQARSHSFWHERNISKSTHCHSANLNTKSTQSIPKEITTKMFWTWHITWNSQSNDLDHYGPSRGNQYQRRSMLVLGIKLL